MTETRAIYTEPSRNPRRRGMGPDALDEEVPSFVSRATDEVICGDNNTWIVLGRDRTPATNDQHSAASVVDGYGGRGWQAAGAIDIVVGRGAPFPVGKMDQPAASKEDPNIHLDPIFGVEMDPTLTGTKMFGDYEHTGLLMDAARIYISQRTDIDAAFELSEGWTNPSPDAQTSPRSAIAMKADELRFVSRQGIKLVTGPLMGNKGEDRVNSQGGDVSATFGIDLIAANGNLPEGQNQEPLVKGLRLVAALEEVQDMISALTGIVTSLWINQFVFNVFTATHFHPEIILLGFPGVPPPTLFGNALPYYTAESMNKILPSLLSHKLNVGFFALNYLSPAFDGYICSRYNSTN